MDILNFADQTLAACLWVMLDHFLDPSSILAACGSDFVFTHFLLPHACMNTGWKDGQTWVAYTCILALRLRASIFACLPTDQALSGTLVSWPAVAGQTLTPMLQFVTPCSVLAGWCMCPYFVLVVGQAGRVQSSAKCQWSWLTSCRWLLAQTHATLYVCLGNLTKTQTKWHKQECFRVLAHMVHILACWYQT